MRDRRFAILGLFHGRRRSIEWPEFFTDLGRSLNQHGFLCAISLPLLWLVLYFSLAFHLRVGLGHWPTSIGQSPGTWLFAVHEKSTWLLAGVMALSLYALPAVIVLGFALKRWRHVAVYALGYGAAVLTAFLLMNLAPSSFVHWWWD
jgi:hypothetical protein